MRERIEKFAVMPFTISCATPSSTAIKDQHIRKASGGGSVLARTSSSTNSEIKYGNVAKRSDSGTTKSLHKEHSFSQPPPPVESSIFTIPFSKSLISSKLQRFFKGLRALSQLFVYKEEEMQIGYPTDVRHVAHIGWDGSSGACKSWIGELRGHANHSSVNGGDESQLEQLRCPSWIEDAPSLPNWAPQDLLGTLGLQPERGGASPQFNLFEAADAKAEKAKALSLELEGPTSSKTNFILI